jgi:hypothetical protein
MKSKKTPFIYFGLRILLPIQIEMSEIKKKFQKIQKWTPATIKQFAEEIIS